MSVNSSAAVRDEGVAKPVVKPGEFAFAVAHTDHPHIGGMTSGLLKAGAELKFVYEPNKENLDAYCKKFPQAKVVSSLDEILNDKSIRMVANAGINNVRADVGMKALRAGKDFFSDKPLFTTMEQLDAAKKAVAETGRRYFGYFSERLHVECAVKAGELVKEGRIGTVVNVIGMGPHQARINVRPPWFFDREQYGGILCDIGSHQLEQFLYFTGAKDATIVSSSVANKKFRDHPGLEDFGDMHLVGDNGATGYFRLDWYTPDALGAWGDGRIFLLGTEGYIEMRKYIDAAGTKQSDTLLLVNKTENEFIQCRGKVGYPFFGEMILDCLNGTDNAQTQEHAFKTSELAIRAQAQAQVLQ